MVATYKTKNAAGIDPGPAGAKARSAVEDGGERLGRGHHDVARIEARVHQALQDGDRDPVVGVAEAVADEARARPGRAGWRGSPLRSAAASAVRGPPGPGRHRRPARPRRATAACWPRRPRRRYRTSQVSPARSSWPRSPLPFFAMTCRICSFIPVLVARRVDRAQHAERRREPGRAVHAREQERVGGVRMALVVDDQVLLGDAVRRASRPRGRGRSCGCPCPGSCRRRAAGRARARSCGRRARPSR